jgi:hypothetical protein
VFRSTCLVLVCVSALSGAPVPSVPELSARTVEGVWESRSVYGTRRVVLHANGSFTSSSDRETVSGRWWVERGRLVLVAIDPNTGLKDGRTEYATDSVDPVRLVCRDLPDVVRLHRVTTK